MYDSIGSINGTINGTTDMFIPKQDTQNLDVFDNTLNNPGRAKNNIKVINSNIQQYDGSTTVEFSTDDIDFSGLDFVDLEFEASKSSSQIISMSQYSNSTNSMAFLWYTNGSIGLYIKNGAANSANYQFESYNEVHTFRFVFDGTLTGNIERLKLYIDGEQKPLDFVDTIPSSLPNINNPFQFGKLASLMSDGKLGKITNRNRAGNVINEWLNDAGTGNKCFDSAGDAHGTINNYDVDEFHTTDIRIPSTQNEEGYTFDEDGSISGIVGAFIPRDYNNPTLDIYGNPLQYIGEVPKNTKIINSTYAEFEATDYITCTLTGTETVISSIGTSVATISANRIDFTAGTMSNLLLSNGDLFRFSTGYGLTAYEVVNLNHGVLNGIDQDTFWKKDDTGIVPPNNMKYGFSQGLYLNGVDAYIRESALVLEDLESFEIGMYFDKEVSPTSSGIVFGSLNNDGSLIAFGSVTGSYVGESVTIWNTSSGLDRLFLTDTIPVGYHTLRVEWNASDSIYDVYIDNIKKITYGNNLSKLNSHLLSLGRRGETTGFGVGSILYSKVNDTYLQNGFDVYGSEVNTHKLYIPAFNSTHDVLGNLLTNPQLSTKENILHINNSENTFLNYKSPKLFKADTLQNYVLFEADGTPVAYSHDDIEYDKDNYHIWFANNEARNKRDLLLYSEVQTGYDLTRIEEFIKKPI